MDSIVFTLKHGDEIMAMCHDSNYQTWYVGTRNAVIYECNSSFETQRWWQAHYFGSVTSLMIPSYGGLMSSFKDGTIKYFDMEHDPKERWPTPKWMTKVDGGFILCLAEVSGGRVAVGMNDTLHVLDKNTGKTLVCKGHVDKISAVIFLGEGFASGSPSRICVWSSDGELEKVVDKSGRTLLLSPCGRLVAAGADRVTDNIVKLFSLPTWDTLWVLKADMFSFSSDGRYLTCGFRNCAMKKYSCETGELYSHRDAEKVKTGWFRVIGVFFTHRPDKVLYHDHQTVHAVRRGPSDFDAKMASLISARTGSAFKELFERLQKMI